MAARVAAAVGAAVLSVLCAPASAADLHPKTIAAFDEYVRVTEAQAAVERAFLRVDRPPDAQRSARLAALQRGELVIERLETRDGGRRMETPDGLIHHWVGVVFIPRVTLDMAVALLQDYDHHSEIFRPAVARSRLLSREGDTFQVYLRFALKKVITVVVNSDHDAQFTRPGPDRVRGRVISRRIAEVDHPDTAEEHEKPVGHDGGFLWRFNTYWSVLERDGGTYVQCESISLSRGIPLGFGWLIGPFITSIPRESLEFTLGRTRAALAQQVR